ncbi:MAG: CoA transferase [Pseudomonadota bacterium]
MSRAFADIRVVDLSDRLSAAFAARLFGDFGADVILVESRAGHALRAEPPYLHHEPGVERSLLHGYVNWNKRSVDLHAVDLASLIASAHVVITSGAETPDELSALPADGVHLSLTPHGLTGPLAAFPGNNLTACARVGWAAINRYQDETPLQLPHNQTGYIAGVSGFVAAAAALLRARRTGHGERIDASEIEALANTCAPWATLGNFIGGDNFAYGPYGPRERGRPGPLWQAKNGQINYGYGDWGFWTDAMTFLGLDDLAQDETYIPQWGRNQQPQAPVREGLAAATADRDKWELFYGLLDRRCIAGVVQNAEELLTSEHLQTRDFIVQARIAEHDVATAGAPVKLSATPWRLRRSAPTLGQDTADVVARERLTQRADAARSLPLHGIRVLCFTQAWAGTYGTELLALLGADVVQIETVKRPDVWRGAGSPVPPGLRNPQIKQNPLNTNGMYNTVNLNKRAITLDMSQPRGKELFWQMVPNFDVIADNFSPHVMANWGITLETLHEVNPAVIMASVSGYGRTGPLAEYAANGATTEPMAGLSSLHGYEGEAGQNTGGLIPDPITGCHLAAAIITALHHREQTGEAQRIDAGMLEAVAVGIGDAMAEFDANADLRGPRGNRHPRIAPHNIYAAANGEWVALAAESDAAFAALATHLELEVERWPTMADRKADEAELDRHIGAWMRDQDAAGTATTLGRLGLAAARVEPFLDIYRHPSEHFRSRGFLIDVTHPECGTHPLPTAPWVLRDTPEGEIRPAPCFGQHSQEVFEAELGLTADDYKMLVEQGLTGTERV